MICASHKYQTTETSGQRVHWYLITEILVIGEINVINDFAIYKKQVSNKAMKKIIIIIKKKNYVK